MKHTLFVILLLGAVVVSFIIYGCGQDSIGGSGQCSGVDESGLCVSISSIAPKDTKNVDIVRNSDCDGDTGTNDPEIFSDHSASVTIETSSYYTSSVAAKFVTFTRYTVDFSLSSGYEYTIDPPAISSKEYNETFKITSGSSGTFDIRFMDIETKNTTLSNYTNNGWNGEEFPSYTATYTFYGTDDFKRSIDVRGFFTFTIGNYDNCSG